jgi:hypothetical protein
MIDKGMDNAKQVLKGLIAIANKRTPILNQVKSQL